MSVTFDTNILVYAADAEAGRRHGDALALLKRASASDAVLVLQSLAEFFHVTTRKQKLSPDEARRIIEDWLDIFPVATADPEGLTDAIEAVEAHRLAFWDAMLWAAARRAGCGVLFSEDFQDGRTLGGVTFVDPFADHNAVLMNAVLPEAG